MRTHTYTILLTFLGTTLFVNSLFPASHSAHAQDIVPDQSIQDMQSVLAQRKKTIAELQGRIADHERNIEQRRREAASLTNQITLLDEQIKKLELDIELTLQQIAATEIEIKENEQEIIRTQEKIASKKDQIARYIQVINRLDRRNIISILAQHQSISEFFMNAQIAEQLEQRITHNLGELKLLKDDLDKKNEILISKKDSLEHYAELTKQKTEQVESTRVARAQVLVATKNSEQRFRDSLKSLKSEQNAINSDIVSLEREIRDKVQQGGLEKLKALGSAPFIWPVPKNTITAEFHDPDYPFRNVFEHPAVDIRAGQGTQIRAAAPGFVARAKDGGLNYSYIMVIHNNGLATVYGHVSKIVVKEEQFVNQGDVIGYSGGLPGTPGAGKLTTGAHLHFEVRLRGIPVNPREYLP